MTVCARLAAAVGAWRHPDIWQEQAAATFWKDNYAQAVGLSAARGVELAAARAETADLARQLGDLVGAFFDGLNVKGGE